jgi:hypothetical protein
MALTRVRLGCTFGNSLTEVKHSHEVLPAEVLQEMEKSNTEGKGGVIGGWRERRPTFVTLHSTSAPAERLRVAIACFWGLLRGR